VTVLIARARSELGDSIHFANPVRVSRAPGRLDVMGGIADYTGSLVCEMPLDRAAASILQPRADRNVQVFSFNLLDEHKPFTLTIPIDRLAEETTESLRREFSAPGRRWAGYIAGCVHVLHQAGIVDVTRSMGLNVALLSTVPSGAGISSSAAIEVATMMNLLDHYGVRDAVDAMQVAAMCQRVENEVVGAPCGIMDQVTSCAGEEGSLLQLLCQPHELQGHLPLPGGVRVIGINSNVKHSVGGGVYGRTRCAAFMGHRIIVETMRKMAHASGHVLEADPMRSYLANLDADDYKRLFRPHLPESIKGGQFLLQYGSTVDKATTVEPDTSYHVQGATDHHVLEARRVREFVRYLLIANTMQPGDRQRKLALDKAGHLMYASHESYTNRALLGADECDLLVQLVRDREHMGLYGARITGGGSGGTVAVLCDDSTSANHGIAEIMRLYQTRTGRTSESFTGSSPGAWHVGTELIR
jgi:L-arabinokinase